MTRFQGAWVSTEDIEAMVAWWSAQVSEPVTTEIMANA